MKQLLLILLCLPLALAGQGRKDNAQPAQQAAAILPFRLYDNHMVVSGSIGGYADTLHFIFDTGSEVTILHEGVAKKLQLQGRQEAGVSGTNNMMIKVGTTTLNVLYLGKARLPFVKAYLENILEFRNGPLPIDGIIGVDLLKAYTVKIDYVQQQLVLYRSGKTPSSVPGRLVPFRLNFATPVLEAVLQLPGGQSLTGRFHVISGGEYGVLFNWPYVEKNRLNTLLPTLGTEKVQDLLKTLTYTNSSLPFLAIGPYRLEQVPVSYSPDVNDKGALSEVAGSIGYEVWKQFRSITINYNARELYLEK